MPILTEPSERPGCLPASKDEPILPSLTSHGASPESHRGRHSRDPALKQNASAPGSESSTPFKLPSIDRSKSNSVSSLASDNKFGQRLTRGRSQDRRSRLCRSPSCPSELAFWYDDHGHSEEPPTPDSTRVRHQSNEHSYFTHREDSTSSSVKLPSIFQSRGSITSSIAGGGTLTGSNSSTHTSRDTSPFSFKREPTFISLHTARSPDMAMHHKLSPRIELNSRCESVSDRHQSTALLLPISNKDASNSKSKRKRKKVNDTMVKGDGSSDAEKLLREKLGAIERRECGEKTDLSDTAFINQVKDETTIANKDKSYGGREGKSSASNNLSSKPPIYQNSPTRIKTEKSVAPVNA